MALLTTKIKARDKYNNMKPSVKEVNFKVASQYETLTFTEP